MKNIVEIAKLVTKQRIKKVDLFEPSKSKVNEKFAFQLYNGIVKNVFSEDEEAARIIYGSIPSDKKYQMLKSRLKSRLLNMLWFIDSKKHYTSKYSRAIYDCNKKLHAARILMLAGAKSSCDSLAKEALSIAEEYKLYDNMFLSARLLAKNFSFYGNEKKFKYYINIQNKAFEEYLAEMKSEEYYENIRMKLILSASPDQSIKRQCHQYFQKLKYLARNHHSYFLHFNMYRLWYYYLSMDENYKAALKVCNLGQNYLRDNPPFNQSMRMGELALMKMECCLQLKDYRNGRENAKQCRELFPANSANFYIFLEYYFLLLMHTAKYAEARDLINEVLKDNPGFLKFPEDRIEKWKIFDAYLNFISPVEDSDGKHEFKLMKFLNEVPQLSKDKAGYNITIITAQLLFLLEQNQYLKIIDKIDSLKQYANRYMKDKNQRSYYFIKMILSLGTYDFDQKLVQRRVHQYFLKLKAAKNIYKGTVESLEVVPFEQLWSVVLQKLKTSGN